MILDIAGGGLIHVTAQYSNAVLVAVLPYFSDVSDRLGLPTPHPISQKDVSAFRVLPFRQTTASARLNDGTVFDFTFGFVDKYISPNAPTYEPQRPDPSAPRRDEMTEAEAVREVRDAIGKLGIPLEDVFADATPRVAMEKKRDPNSARRFRIQWIDPRGSGPTLDQNGRTEEKDGLVAFPAVNFEVNAETRAIERFNFAGTPNVRRQPPKIFSATDAGAENPEPTPENGAVNPAYAWKLVPIMLDAIDGYGKKLSLPVPRPLTTNDVDRVKITDNGGWPHCEVTLKDGWRFVYRHSMVNGYYSPEAFVTTGDRPFHAKDFAGKWNLGTNQAIERVKAAVAELGFPTNDLHMDFTPNIIFAAGEFRRTIPRYFFEWDYANDARDDLQSKVEAEVNADTGKLESLYYDDKAYWENRPKIDAPISGDR